jgi:hypothetical protein
MTDIQMSLGTRIRVIEHALKLLDAFNNEFRMSLADGTTRMSAEVQLMARSNAEEEGRLRRRLAKLRKEADQTPAPDGVDHGLVKALGIALSDTLTGFDLIDPSQPLSEGSKLRIKATSPAIFQADLVAESQEDLNLATADLMTAVFSLEFQMPGSGSDADLFFNIAPAPQSDEASKADYAATFEISRAA